MSYIIAPVGGEFLSQTKMQREINKYQPCAAIAAAKIIIVTSAFPANQT